MTFRYDYVKLFDNTKDFYNNRDKYTNENIKNYDMLLNDIYRSVNDMLINNDENIRDLETLA